MHFLCLEPRETEKSVLKFGPEVSLLAAGSPVLIAAVIDDVLGVQ